LGCFTDVYPFSGSLARPIAFLPDTPQKIATKFILYNKKTSSLGETISAANFSQSKYDFAIGAKFITHGFVQHGFIGWVIALKDAILSVDNVNVVVVDWSKGNGLPYTQATANTQVVGRELAKLINAIITKGPKAKDFHLIGHSLGSHISGYAGEKIPGLGKITGLDPAGPYFENTDPRVRLDPTDAVFVEAIHTDGTATIQAGLGLMQALGHVDFYPNGGLNQPSCPEVPGKLLGAIFGGLTLDVATAEQSLACSHISSITYYTESITDKSCKFTAYPCSSKEDFNAGKCVNCGTNGCNRMGYYSLPTRDLSTLYLNTQNPLISPLCLQNYRLTLYSHNLNNIKQARGKFTISFTTASQQKSSIETFDDSETTFKQNSVETRLISLRTPLNSASSIQSAIISYTKTSNLVSGWLYDSSWSFIYIELRSGDSQEIVKLCPVTLIIDSTKSVEFKKC
jgi:pancreatic triacylglycerol lipase